MSIKIRLTKINVIKAMPRAPILADDDLLSVALIYLLFVFVNVEKVLTQGNNYFSKVCRDLIAEKAHFKICNCSIKVGKKATKSAIMGELGRYPLFLEVLLNMIIC
jgi:hypothetical protein